MLRRSLQLFPVLLLLTCMNPASADNDPGSHAVVNASAEELDQIVYKGLVGNLLDGIPMNPSKRVDLQRTNAVISSTLSGRSLAVLAGLSNPVLLLGGFVWGVWAASNIKAEDDGAKTVSDARQAGAEIATQEGLVALLNNSPAARETPAQRQPETASAKPTSARASDEPSRLRPPVVKVWLPQHPSVMAVAR